MGFRRKQKTLNLLFINKTQKLFHYGLSKSTIQMEHLNMDWIKKKWLQIYEKRGHWMNVVVLTIRNPA